MAAAQHLLRPAVVCQPALHVDAPVRAVAPLQGQQHAADLHIPEFKRHSLPIALRRGLEGVPDLAVRACYLYLPHVQRVAIELIAVDSRHAAEHALRAQGGFALRVEHKARTLAYAHNPLGKGHLPRVVQPLVEEEEPRRLDAEALLAAVSPGELAAELLARLVPDEEGHAAL